ncbi:MAG TPA: hypothetical protein VEQ85_06400 [Lacipirellulaceae bacterium]|nr:hypothetical protein [Lacipirellulaceae bacterium]
MPNANPFEGADLRATRWGIRLLALLCICVATQRAAAAGPQYRIVTLQPLPGTIDTIAFGLNDVGMIVGAAYRDRSTNVGQARPVVWDREGVPHELWSDPNTGGILQDINNAGEVVGRYGFGAGIPLPGPGIPYGRAFYWNSISGLQDIGFEPVGNGQAAAINESGQVAGSSSRFTTIEVDGMEITGLAPRAFLWDATNGIRDLGEAPGQYSGTFASDVNNRGEVVGHAVLPTGRESAFVWDMAEGLNELPSIAGGDRRAVASNDISQVLGFEFGLGGLLWDLPSGSVLRVPGGFELNNLGQAVGGRSIWDEKHGLRLLSDLIPQNTGWQIDFAFDINDAGEIVGYGEKNGQVRGFLLIPIPEPHSAEMAIAVMLTATARFRRFGCAR